MGVSQSPATKDTGRRLSRQARREQLVSAALPLVARHGPADFSLDEVAERAGVTRNLLYHYFPGGRADLVGAVVDQAERQLAGPPPPDNLAQAVSRVLDHALAPTHAWRIHRTAGALPALPIHMNATTAAVDALRDFTGLEPSVSTELALHGYVAYAEAVLDRARAVGVPRAEVIRLLSQALRGLVAPG